MDMLMAPCGVDCSQCEAFIATRTNDDALKQKLADDYLKQTGKTVNFSELDCVGCTQEGRHISFCDQCGIRACAREKRYQTCAECSGFPCEKGSFIWTENSKSKAALEKLRRA